MNRTYIDMWNYKIGLNNQIQQNKNCANNFFYKNTKGRYFKKLHAWRIKHSLQKEMSYLVSYCKI